MRFSIVLALFLLKVFQCQAQENDTTVYRSFGIHGHYGFIIPHASEIEPVSHTRPAGIELNYSRLSTSYDAWKVFDTFWNSGIQAAYFNFGNPQVTGSSFLLTAYVEPVIVQRKKYILALRGGAGISYHTRVFDTIENPANKFFATAISFPLYVSARINYKITNKTMLALAGNYNHISNGGIKQPNYGMNFPTVSLGMYYYPDELPVLKRKYRNDTGTESGISVITQLLTSYRVIDKTDIYPEKGAFALGFHMRASKQLTRYYALNAGGEIIFDRGIKEILRRENSDLDYKRVALTAGQDFLFGQTVFTQYFGFYVYSPYKAFRNIYQKYELSYNISPLLSAGAFLKAHLYVAELMGLQINLKW